MCTFNSQSDPSLYFHIIHITIGTGSYIGSYTTSTTNMYNKDFTYRSVINSVDSSCKARTNCVLKFLEKFEKEVHCNESICTGLDEKTTDEKQRMKNKRTSNTSLASGRARLVVYRVAAAATPVELVVPPLVVLVPVLPKKIGWK